MKSKLFYFISALFCVFSLQANHAITGILTYAHVEGYAYTYEFTLTYYTASSDSDQIIIYYGDGTSDSLPLTEEMITDGIKKSTYVKIHSFTSPGVSTISFTDPSLIAAIVNIDGSVNVPFYTETMLYTSDPILYGFNSSPIITGVPITSVAVGDILNYNMGAYDPDGDKLTYSFFDPDFSGYDFPAAYCYGPCELTIDPETGDIIWNTAESQGIFLLPVLINEYREDLLISSTQVIVMIYVGTAIDGEADAVSNIDPTAFTAYPDPADEIITVNIPPQTNMLQVFSMNGMLIKTLPASDLRDKCILNIGDVATGTYLIKCSGDYGISTACFIKQ